MMRILAGGLGMFLGLGALFQLALGYGKACSKVVVAGVAAPVVQPPLAA